MLTAFTNACYYFLVLLLLRPTLASLRRSGIPQQSYDNYRPFIEQLEADDSSLTETVTSEDHPAEHPQQHSLLGICIDHVLLGAKDNALLEPPHMVSWWHNNNTTEYAAARACHIHRPQDGSSDYRPPHQIIVQPRTVAQAAAIVRCVAVNQQPSNTNTTPHLSPPPVSISARSGAHGFTGDACRGHVILDLSRLSTATTTAVKVDTQAQTVTWSAGLLHGQVYDPLWSQHGWVLPGGAEMMVGTGGLWLGCGRGRLANVYGMTCEHLRGIEFIDAEGTVQWANATVNADMFWMARGGGGTFPGIVTKFMAQAYPLEHDVVYNEKCGFENTALNMKALITAFLEHLDDINESSRQTFIGLSAERAEAGIKFLCFGCTLEKLRELADFKEILFSRVREISPEARANCHDQFHSYEGYMLHETTWDDYVTSADFQKRSLWPEWINVRILTGYKCCFLGTHTTWVVVLGRRCWWSRL